MNQISSITRSYRAMPGWVQIWVAILFLVNAACIGFLDSAVGQAVALAGAFIILTNGPIMFWYGGMNRALAIPHLMAWIPLAVFLVQQLKVQPDLDSVTRGYAVAVLIINGISLAFDVFDTKRWLSGERDTPGVD